MDGDLLKICLNAISFKGLFSFLLKNSFTISLADDEKRCQSGHQATSQVSSTWMIFNESAFIFWILQGLSWIIFCQTVLTILLLSRMRVMRANVGKGKVQLMGGNFRFAVDQHYHHHHHYHQQHPPHHHQNHHHHNRQYLNLFTRKYVSNSSLWKAPPVWTTMLEIWIAPANMQLCKYANMQICKYADKN